MLKKVNISKFLGALGILLVPAIYNLLRVHFVINMQGDVVDVIAQSSWIALLFEIIAEGMVLPMYFIINNEKKDKNAVISACFTYTMIISTIFAFIIGANLPQLTSFMKVPEAIVQDTIICNSLELVNSVFEIGIKFLMLLALFDNRKISVLHKAIGVKLLAKLSCDILFLSNAKVIDLGVRGPAVSSMVAQLIIAMVLLLLLKKAGLMPKCNFSIRYITKDYVSRCGLLMLEVLVRNLAFSLMIIKLINTVQEQGTYWVANNITWSWLLIPCLAMSDVIRATGINDKKTYFKLTNMMAILYIVSLFFCQPFMKYVLQIEDTSSVMKILLIQAPFYVTYIYNSVLDSQFHHLGKSKELLIQSILVNSLYYGALAILHYANIITFTLEGIALMFGVGMLLDFCITLYQAKKQNQI